MATAPLRFPQRGAAVRARTVRSGDVELAVFEQGDPAAPTVLLVHGYPDTHRMWDGVAARLAEDYHVVRYDVRGAGASSAPAGAPPTAPSGWPRTCSPSSTPSPTGPRTSWPTTGAPSRRGRPSPTRPRPRASPPTPPSPARAWTTSRTGCAAG
ncbi:alpha/beta fold hydrolase [Actinokineospora soli]|uniref:Alpha/beta fold hydrolase n=1 Tax=Actinokineospora soli TaxID=1048753 RepID=A0ABW2TIS5_9PSEU